MAPALRTNLQFQGPIAALDDTDRPFGGAASPVGIAEPSNSNLLRDYGYVEEEYFLSGTVEGEAYKTSVLVRGPADPTRFSGLVALETVHMQGALGFWQTSHNAVMSEGHAWMTVASQRGGLEGPVKQSNPARYAGLHVPVATASDSAAAAMNDWSQADSPDIPGELFANDAISNAIMTQLGIALKSGVEGGPLAGTPVTWLIMGGASQTGVATLNYIANAHATARMPDGSPVYDGFLPMAAPGWQPLNCDDVPVIQIFAEGDLTLFGCIAPDGYLAARPDSDSPHSRYRCYQIAGASHLPTRGLADARGIPQLGIGLEPHERFTQFPAAPFYQGAFVNLVKWVRDGTVPPVALPIEIAHGTIVTDAAGNAVGGLRSPYLDVATARFIAARYIRNLIGVEIPFPAEELRRRYGSPAEYLRRFDSSMDSLVEAGWILPADSKILKAEQAASTAF